MDLEHADLIIIQGSNFAENHPVGFRFVTKAKERGAKVIHIDPRFTRTSALADQYLPIRSGTDIAFTGGIINYVLQNNAYFKEYVVNYTNASYIVDERFADTEDLDGIFSGFDPDKGTYDPKTWKYELDESAGRRDERSERQRPRCAGRRHVGRERRPSRARHEAAEERPDAAAPALRDQPHAQALRALHARDGRAHLRHAQRSVHRAVQARRREQRPRQDDDVLLRDGLGAAHRRRAEHSRRGDAAGAARQHRAPGRRHHGAARARVDPGLYRHRDAVRSLPGLHQVAVARTR